MYCLQLATLLAVIIIYCIHFVYCLIHNPKIISTDGHLVFECGLERNITILLEGNSHLTINNEYDIIKSLEKLKLSLTQHTRISLDHDIILSELRSDVSSLSTRVYGSTGLDYYYRALQNRSSNANLLLTPLKTRMDSLELQVQLMHDIFLTDYCQSNPCRNGASCLNNFAGFVCKCSRNFEGITCDIDVNECELYDGTDLGCQNGAQCVNQFGTYTCICQPGWFGIHCTQLKGACSQSPTSELCGHGTCVGTNNTFGYTCICDQGWKTNDLMPACTMDVDECLEGQTSCMTKCINLPGSFMCAPCAAGLTGNGVLCRDIDECSIQNGGCSLNPQVKCINSYGSYHCGACPLGWSGNGHTCQRLTSADNLPGATSAVSKCSNDNICSPLAICYEISNTVVCNCPNGFVGSGFGVNGCVVGTAKNCLSQPCMNGGTCLDNGDSFSCICPMGFSEPTCKPQPSPCSPNPCHNDGNCHEVKTSDIDTFLCECIPGFQGEKCEIRASYCGGTLRGETGHISYPSEESPPQYVVDSLQYAWIITTDESLVLNITFNNFGILGSTQCRFNWLQINNGPSASSPIIGRFCGTSKSTNIISSTHQLYLWFHAENSSSKEIFDLEWNSIKPQCGGLINVTAHGTISSPNSPENYPKNRDCYWTLKAQNDKRLKLVFFSLQIENHDSCNYDYVEIIDVISDVTLVKYCNSSQPQPLMLTTHEAIVHFHSDNIGSDKGFEIFYSTEERIHNCGGVYTAKVGIIRSPVIESGEISCEYEINMDISELITLTFVSFRFGSADCLEIYDVKTSTNENILQAKYCGEYQIKPTDIHSLYNKIVLKFHGKSGAEFQLKYKTDCSYLFETPEGILASPHYPQLSNKDLYCTYKLMVEPNNVISVHIDDFDLNDSSLEETDCAYTSLVINDDVNKNIMGPFCGQKAPLADFVSKTNMIILHLQTGLSSKGRGFKLSYKAVPMGTADCGGIYTKPGYSIHLSTDVESLYMHDMTCYWIIVAPKRKSIMIDWKSFNLDDSSDCSYNFVELYDNLADHNSQALEKYCNAHYPQPFLTHSHMLTVKFVTDGSDSTKSFEFTYKFIDSSNQCGGKIHSSNGKINTPNWPSNYMGDLDCIWVINTPTGTQMQLQIEIFDVEMTKNCSSDWLEIRNGGSNHSTLLGRFCGNLANIPHNMPSFTNQMYLHFHSNGFINRRGFQIHWSVFSNGCGGNLEGEEGVVTSPFYPQPYPNNAECDWRLHVHPGSAIHITIIDLELEINSKCRYDTLSIFEGTTDSKIHLASICKMSENKEPLEYVINNNEALIRLRTDETNRGKGFMLSYRANCSVTLDKYYGVIESNNYGVPYNEYSDDVNCTLTLKAPKGNHIQAEFTYYDPVNKNSVLDIRDGNNKTYTIQSQREKINSSSDTIVIKQRTNKLIFQLEYSMVGCIEAYRSDMGTFQSPNYPKPYPSNMECLWEIFTQPGRGIQIEIDSLDLEDSVNCTKDALVISPHYHSDNVKERHCGKHEKLVISTTSHKLYVRFYSDGQVNGKGFQVTYTTQRVKCGGTLQSKNGVITSPNYPNNYPENSDCEWTVTVTPHHAIIFTMDEFDMWSFRDCVEAYEESSNVSEEPIQLFKICDTIDTSNTWRSKGNAVTVRFHSEDSMTAEGFKLSYIEDCGERIIVDEINYATIKISKHAPVKQICEWQLIAKDPSNHITLSFNHLQLNPVFFNQYRKEENCRDADVIIYDGITDTSPVRSRFCKTHPPDITSKGHALTLKFPIGVIGEIDARAFIMDNTCGSIHRSISGKFASPYYPDSYPVNIQCTWRLYASQGNSIGLTFEAFDLEDSLECNNDYVEVRYGDGMGLLVGLYCGQRTPAALKGSQNVTIHFNSNNDIVGAGFVASYYYAKHNDINGTGGTIESPSYPSKFHSEDVYSWRITVDRNYVVLLTIKHIMDTDIPYIKFYDGYSDNGASIDYSSTHIVRSSNNILYFTAARGPFQFEWQELSKEVVNSNETAKRMSEICGEQNLYINNSKLLFSSPGYPNSYASDLHCSWTIIPSNAATHAEISFILIDLEVDDQCLADYVKIYKSSDLQNWQELKKLCKKSSNKFENFEGNPYLKLEFATDNYINRAGFQAVISTLCGGELAASSGFVNITELWTNTYKPEVCVWTIRTRQGSRVRLTFPDVWLDNANQKNVCETYFLVRNGMAEDSPFLGKGKYCDNDITDVLETSSNRAYIKFSSTGNPAYRASFYYEEISPECSREIVLNNDYKWDRIQTISTPNYPNIPNPHSECIWKVRAPLHTTITLDFFGDYDLIPANSDSKLCELEYVQINDGLTELSPVIGKFCGNTKPNTIRSTGNTLRVHYFTDISQPHKGFQANVSLTRCGGSFYEPEGIIHAPLMQLNAHEREVECVYILEMPLGYILNISIDKVNFLHKQQNMNCKEGTHLELQEINPLAMDEISKTLFLCNSTNQNLLMETHKLRIVLSIKNGIYNSNSFQITYSALGDRCGGTITAERGILQTPNYPQVTRPSIDCVWHLKVSEGRRIKVEFLDIGIYSRQMGAIARRMIFSNDPKRTSIIKIITDHVDPEPVYSYDNTMTISIFMLSYHNNRGLKLQFSAEEYSIHCPYFLGFDEEPVTSQSLKFKRDDNEKSLYCSYDLKPKYNQTLTIQILKQSNYDLNHQGYGYYCEFSPTVELLVDKQFILRTQMCRNITQTSFKLPYAVEMVVKGEKSSNGLRELELQLASYNCGGIWPLDFYESFVITQPEMNNYTGRLECAWAVWGLNGALAELPSFADILENIQIHVTFTINFQGKCDEEYLVIYHGPNQKSPHLGRYCEQISNISFVARGGIYFEFITEEYNPLSVFNLTIQEGSECGGELKYPYKEIIFDRGYKNNVECIWHVTAEAGYHLAAIFKNFFFIESSSNCTKDYLKIQQLSLNREWVDIAKLCGRSPPAMINTTSTEMRLIFRSDSDITGKGFTMDFQRNCGGILYASQNPQQLTSPNNPRNYPNKLMCNYTIVPDRAISATETNDLYIQFRYIDLELSPFNRCLYDNLTITTYNSKDQEQSTTLCGWKTNFEFRSKKSIQIVFRTDDNNGLMGFVSSYGLKQCGSIVTNSSLIETPKEFVSQMHAHDRVCSWLLQAPENYKIIIRFEEIDFEKQGKCSNNAVEVYKGLRVNEQQRLVKVCTNIREIINIAQNTALIRYISDAEASSKGFKALVKFIPNCDHHIYLDFTNSSYEFATYSGSYNNNLDCSWLFTTSRDRQLSLEFSRFHVENSSHCSLDYLVIHDGSKTFADQMGKFCGHNLPRPLVTSRSALLMRFVTDFQGTSSGFLATIKSVPRLCGREYYDLSLQGSVTIASPDDGMGKFTNNINCIWKIKSDTNIHLHFEKLDLNGPGTEGLCSRDYVKIINSDNIDVIDKSYGSKLVFSGLRSNHIGEYSYAVEHIYCGDTIPDDYFSTSKTIFIKFKSSSSSNITKSGFKLKATAAKGCFRNFTGTQGRIQLFDISTTCDISIKAPLNYTLSLFYNFVDFTEHDCRKEYIEVFDARTNSSIQKLCDFNHMGTSLFSSTHELRMRLKMTSYYNRIDVTYLASANGPGCGGDFYNTQGLFTNPFYPNHVRNNSDCRWNIRVPANLKVYVKFPFFDMGARSTCHTDYLQIVEYEDNASGAEEMIMRQFCGQDKPKFYQSSKSFLTIRFHKTFNYDGTGWIITFSGVYFSGY